MAGLRDYFQAANNPLPTDPVAPVQQPVAPVDPNAEHDAAMAAAYTQSQQNEAVNSPFSAGLGYGIQGFENSATALKGLAQGAFGDIAGGRATLRRANIAQQQNQNYVAPGSNDISDAWKTGNLGRYAAFQAGNILPGAAATIAPAIVTGGFGALAQGGLRKLALSGVADAVASRAVASGGAESILARAGVTAAADATPEALNAAASNVVKNQFINRATAGASNKIGSEIGSFAGATAGGTVQSAGSTASSIDPNTPDDQLQAASAKGLAGAFGMGLIQSIPTLSFLHRYGLGGTAADAIASKLSNPVMRTLARVAANAGEQGVVGGAAAGATTAVNRAVHQWITHSPDASPALPEYINSVAGGFFGGFLLGGPAGFRGGEASAAADTARGAAAPSKVDTMRASITSAFDAYTKKNASKEGQQIPLEGTADVSKPVDVGAKFDENLAAVSSSHPFDDTMNNATPFNTSKDGTLGGPGASLIPDDAARINQLREASYDAFGLTTPTQKTFASILSDNQYNKSSVPGVKAAAKAFGDGYDTLSAQEKTHLSSFASLLDTDQRTKLANVLATAYSVTSDTGPLHGLGTGAEPAVAGDAASNAADAANVAKSAIPDYNKNFMTGSDGKPLMEAHPDPFAPDGSRPSTIDANGKVIDPGEVAPAPKLEKVPTTAVKESGADVNSVPEDPPTPLGLIDPKSWQAAQFFQKKGGPARTSPAEENVRMVRDSAPDANGDVHQYGVDLNMKNAASALAHSAEGKDTVDNGVGANRRVRAVLGVFTHALESGQTIHQTDIRTGLRVFPGEDGRLTPNDAKFIRDQMAQRHTPSKGVDETGGVANPKSGLNLQAGDPGTAVGDISKLNDRHNTGPKPFGQEVQRPEATGDVPLGHQGDSPRAIENTARTAAKSLGIPLFENGRNRTTSEIHEEVLQHPDSPAKRVLLSAVRQLSETDTGLADRVEANVANKTEYGQRYKVNEFTGERAGKDNGVVIPYLKKLVAGEKPTKEQAAAFSAIKERTNDFEGLSDKQQKYVDSLRKQIADKRAPSVKRGLNEEERRNAAPASIEEAQSRYEDLQRGKGIDIAEAKTLNDYVKDQMLHATSKAAVDKLDALRAKVERYTEDRLIAISRKPLDAIAQRARELISKKLGHIVDLSIDEMDISGNLGMFGVGENKRGMITLYTTMSDILRNNLDETTNHEIGHAAVTIFDQTIGREATKRMIDKANTPEVRAQLEELLTDSSFKYTDASPEERFVEAYAQWSAGKLSLEPKGVAARFFQAIKDFINGLRGDKSLKAAFQKIDSGGLVDLVKSMDPGKFESRVSNPDFITYKQKGEAKLGSRTAQEVHDNLGREGIAVTHDSPHKFDGKFDWRAHANTGEGAMMHGAGTYVSTADGVHGNYKEAFSRGKTPRNVNVVKEALREAEAEHDKMPDEYKEVRNLSSDIVKSVADEHIKRVEQVQAALKAMSPKDRADAYVIEKYDAGEQMEREWGGDDPEGGTKTSDGWDKGARVVRGDSSDVLHPSKKADAPEPIPVEAWLDHAHDEQKGHAKALAEFEEQAKKNDIEHAAELARSAANIESLKQELADAKATDTPHARALKQAQHDVNTAEQAVRTARQFMKAKLTPEQLAKAQKDLTAQVAFADKSRAKLKELSAKTDPDAPAPKPISDSASPTYESSLNVKPDEVLHFDTKLSEQAPGVREKLAQLEKAALGDGHEWASEGEVATGREFYEALSDKLGGDRQASDALQEAGIAAMAHDSSGGRNGKFPNYVVIDDSRLTNNYVHFDKDVAPAKETLGTATKEVTDADKYARNPPEDFTAAQARTHAARMDEIAARAGTKRDAAEEGSALYDRLDDLRSSAKDAASILREVAKNQEVSEQLHPDWFDKNVPASEQKVPGTGSIREAVEKLKALPEFKAVAKQLGDLSKAVRTKSDVLRENMTLRTLTRTFGTKDVTLMYSNGDVPGSYENGVITISSKIKGAARTAVLMHEFGHHLFDEKISGATPEVKAALQKDYQAWKAQQKEGTESFEVRGSRAPLFTSMRLLDHLGDNASEPLSAANADYLLNAHEYFADQIARALDQHEGVQGKLGAFLGKIAQVTKLAYDLARGVDARLTETSPAVKDWVRSLYEAAAAPDAERAPPRTASGEAPHTADASPDSLSAALSPFDRNALYETFGRKDVMDQLLTGADKETVRMLGDAGTQMSTAINEGFKRWAAGTLELKDRSVFAPLDKLREGVKTVFGIATNRELAERILADAKAGKLDQKANTRVTLEREKQAQMEADGKTGQARLRKQTLHAAEFALLKAKPVARRLVSSLDERIRATGVPALHQLASIIHRQTGERGTGQDMLNAMQQNRAKFWDQATKIIHAIPKEDQLAVIKAAQSQEVMSDPMLEQHRQNVINFFKDMQQYQMDKGVQMGTIKDYVPVVVDPAKVQADSLGFKAMLADPRLEDGMRDYFKSKGWDTEGMSQLDMVNKMHDMATYKYDYTRGGKSYDDTGTQPGGKEMRTRVSEFIYRVGDPALNKLFAKYQTDDLGQMMIPYASHATRRAEIQNALGKTADMKESTLEQLLARASREGATPEHIQLAKDYVNAATGSYAPGLNPAFAKAVGAFDNVFKTKLGDINSQQYQKLSNAIIAYQNVRVLGLGLFGNLIDPLGVWTRSSSVAQTWQGYKTAYQAMAHKDPTFLRGLAESLGTVQAHAATEALSSLYGSAEGDNINGWSQKVNAALFKVNGMEMITNFARLAATDVANKFLLAHAKGANKHSERYLTELGVTADQVKEDPQHPGYVQRNQATDEAIYQFVNESVLRPVPTQKPLWHSDPHYKVASQYKGYLYAFYSTITERMIHEVHYGNYTALAPIAGYLAVTAAAEFAREMVQFGPGGNPNRKDWGAKERLGLYADRSGLAGPKLDTGLGSLSDLIRGNVPLDAVTGPSVSQAQQLGRAAFGHGSARNAAIEALPGQSVYHGILEHRGN